jgi:hypothetical protein
MEEAAEGFGLLVHVREGQRAVIIIGQQRRDRSTSGLLTSGDLASIGEVAPLIGIGGRLAAPPLPHHRAYGSVHGGSIGLSFNELY